MPSYRLSIGYRLFTIGNMAFLTLLALTCLFPLIHVFSVSLSSAQAVSAGAVKLWPVEFSTASYEAALAKKEFLQAFWITIQRSVIGTSTSMILMILLAYPLSKDNRQFRFRTVYAWYFVFTMIFGGGLIPTYVVVKSTGLIDSIWALIIPSAIIVFNVVVLLNFFRNLPKELEESAKLDGANHWTILWRIYVPVSLPALATVLLLTVIWHWNSWFDGLIYMNQPRHYPLQTYLQTTIVSKDLSEMSAQEAEKYLRVSIRTGRAAQIFIAALPILLAYPFLQRFFVKGMIIGSVKE
ncbi:carbohydrate ABC transporter permease [Cohnella soli]|uniref:Carbohydrate ABC transporter permease n=1 Tax=Cohnella soli TaxID=425005 RepID=A0ABW0HTL2_9BACL